MQDDWIGLIPAAGRGIRLGLPYPKELYPVIQNNRYKPIAQYVLDNLTYAGIRHVVFVINETKHQLIGFFGNGNRFGCDISYVVQEQMLADGSSTSPGLAHALDSAYHLVRGKTVFFGMADTIMRPHNVFATAFQHMLENDDVMLVLFDTERPEKFGMVEVDMDGCVQRIVDKPKQTLLTRMWGCIVWRPRFTEYLHDSVQSKGFSDFARIMNEAIQEGFNFRGVHIAQGTYIDLGTYDEIMEMDRQFREG
ncbi:MAG: NTP transferase domain-containing protein [Anaerolineae bacterium]|nr:NTP transferase domain-containing protein [Anaerolineae bacterium]